MLLRLTHIVGDRHAGFILCLLVIACLIWGSVAMELHPDRYPAFSFLDLRQYFLPVQAVHAWLYALVAAFALFGLNLAACLVNSIARLIKNPGSGLKSAAALLFHLALTFTLLAHLYEGLAASAGQTMIPQQPVELPGIGHARLETVEVINHPDGSMKDARATLHIERPDGGQLREVIAFNEPAILDGGRRQIVMLTTQKIPAGAVIRGERDGQELSLRTNEPQAVGNGLLVLQRLVQDRAGTPYAQLLWRAGDGSQQQLFMALDPRLEPQARVELDGAAYRFERRLERPFIVAITRHNPAIPLMIASLALATAAVLLLLLWMRRRRERPLQA